MSDPSLAQLRADKWLYAARFFRTRTLAKAAIEGGKVQMDGSRIKVSRELKVGDILRVRQGWDEKTVVVLGLDAQRRGAPEAQQLYRETEESLTRRDQAAALRKTAGSGPVPAGKPSRQERRARERLWRNSSDD